jgi:hypothetical protein
MIITGCSPDYSIVYPNTIYVEVPVYIEEEVPEDPGLVWVDSFTQVNSVNGTDILWVIDRSCSMVDDKTRLLDGIEAMINSLPTSGWRLNMLSTDPAGYNDQQFPLVPGDTIIEAEAMYNAMNAGGYEKGFSAVQSYIEDGSYASTWMRWDAALLIVFVSDEEEQSTTDFPNVSDFIQWLNQQRSNVYLSSIVNLHPDDSLCNTTTMYEGARYIEATNSYAGVVVDICSEDWSTGVRDASAQVDPYESIGLTHEPVEDSVRAFANGVLYNDWYYDSSDNTVYFTVIPDAGVLIEVGYRYILVDTGIDTGIDTGN